MVRCFPGPMSVSLIMYKLAYTQTTQQAYKRQYPLYKTVRIRNSNLEKIKSRATKYGQSVDDIITDILSQLETGYATPEDQRSW